MKNSIYTVFISTIIALFLTNTLFAEFNNVPEKEFINSRVVKYTKNEVKRSVEQIQNTDIWEQIPGPFGGIVICLAGYNNVLFAGTTGGGLYKSTDYGENWNFISANLPFLDIQKVLFFNDRIIVSNKEFGLYYSDNDGIDWLPLNNGLKNLQVTSIVELDGTLFCSTYGNGIFASTNKGENWLEKNSGLNNKFVNQLTLYRGGLYSATDQGIYVSGNNAETWGTLRTTGPFMHIAVNDKYIFIATNTQVLMTSNNGEDWNSGGSGLGSGIIYSLYSTGPYVMAGRSNGVYVATFVGGQWTNMHTKLQTIRVYSLINLNNFIYTGTSKGVFYSNNFGGTWTESNDGLLNERVLSIFVEKNVIYAGLLDNGIVMSTDNGNTWTDLNLGYRRVSNIYKDQLGLWVISNDTLFITPNNGITWEYRNYGLEGNKIHFISKFKNIYYVGTDDGLFFSTNSGLNWLVKTHSLRKMKIRNMYVDKNDYVYLATADKVYLSRDNMNTWTTSSDGMKSYNLTRITGSDNYLVAGSQPDQQFDAEIYVSYDEARTWVSTDFNYNKQYIHDINLSGPICFVSVKSTGVDENVGVLFSSNSGKSWHEFNEGLTVKDIRDLTIYENTVYAASFGQSLLKREIPGPMPVPALLYPENDAKNIYIEPVLDWESIDGAEIYNIEIADNLTNFNKNIIADFSTTMSELAVPENTFEYESTYYWRVNFNKENRVSDWSDIFSFKTESELPTVTTLISPIDNSTDISVLTELQWESLQNATEYILQVSESDLFETNILEDTITQNNYTFQKGKLEFNKQYFWRVRAVINGYERDWSSSFSFTTLTLNLVSPGLVHPFDDAGDLPLTTFFEWDAVSNADEYILSISTDSQFVTIIYSDTLSQTILNISSGILNWDTEYFWRVKSKFLDYESEWSSFRKFKTSIEVSVDDENLLSQTKFDLTPNPAGISVNISITTQLEGKANIYIVNLLGSKVFQQDIEFKNIYSNKLLSIPINNLPSGKYFVILQTNYGILTKELNILK